MVGQLVRQRREARGLTQTELAEQTGLRQTYISQVEAGDIAMPRDHNLDKLGAVLGLRRGDFYKAAGMLEGLDNGNGQPPAPPPLARDSDRLTVDEMVADMESRQGEWYQRELADARARLTPEGYRDLLVQLYRMTEAVAMIGLGDKDRGR